MGRTTRRRREASQCYASGTRMQLALLAAWLGPGLILAAVPSDWNRLMREGRATPELDRYRGQLKQLLERLVWRARVERCFATITDEVHRAMYDRAYCEAAGRGPRAHFLLQVNASASLLEPDERQQRLLAAVRASGCDLVVLTLLNGWQAGQLLQHLYATRALSLQSRFLLLHDRRLLGPDMLHVWSVSVNAVFLRRQPDDRFSMWRIAFPGILSGVVVLQRLAEWRPGGRIDPERIYKDRTGDLLGVQLPVAVAEHVPMVHLNRTTNSYQGVEIGIVEALAKALNFRPEYYAWNASDSAGWGDYDEGPLAPPNDSHVEQGLIGELIRHRARLAIGDLHLFESYARHVELSVPHMVECLTFLTPESAADNSWQTFILPFSGLMWAAVLLSLLVVGSVFYGISWLNSLLPAGGRRASLLRSRHLEPPSDWRRLSFRLTLARAAQRPARPPAGDIFDDYASCILLTYSMLLYVALPRVPRNWPLRVLTGWYWIYCILLAATYRASFTAILANPAASITIDTLKDLNDARIPPAAGALEHKQFFAESNDETAREVGARMDIVEQPDELTQRIGQGKCAYYDNEFYLRHLRLSPGAGGVARNALHIMRDCIVHMPVVLAMEKNSALKPHVDSLIQRLREGGLITKWLRDALVHLPAEEQTPPEALMNLHKFWSSFVALSIGYLLSIVALLAEHWHFRRVVLPHPVYDANNPGLYYSFKRLYPDA